MFTQSHTCCTTDWPSQHELTVSLSSASPHEGPPSHSKRAVQLSTAFSGMVQAAATAARRRAQGLQVEQSFLQDGSQAGADSNAAAEVDAEQRYQAELAKELQVFLLGCQFHSLAASVRSALQQHLASRNSGLG